MKFKDIYKEVTALLDVSEHTDGGTLDASAVEVVIAGLNSGMRWLAAKAPVRMLDGSDESGVGTGFLRTLTATYDEGRCTVSLPGDFSRVFRVKADGWHKAVSEVVEDISDEYLMLNDAVANATADRPVVALVSGSQKRLEIYPGRNRPVSGEGTGTDETETETGGPEVEVVCYPGEIDVDLGVHVGNYDWERVIALPPRAKNALIYYVASLVCMSWGNPLYKELMAMAENALK